MSEIKSNENNFLIFFRNENYKQYQIKNSDNTENKAASKTRDKHSQKKINIQRVVINKNSTTHSFISKNAKYQ